MSSGIYLITNKYNGRRYVGSTNNIRSRYQCHMRQLARGTHSSAKMRVDVGKYGRGAFLFEVLEEWEPEFLIGMEQWWINTLRPEYNERNRAVRNSAVTFSRDPATLRAPADYIEKL